MYEIVNMGPEHVAQMSEIEKLCFKTPWSYDMLFRELNNHLATYFVAEFGEIVVAYTGYYKVLDEGHITNIAVRPNYRRRHIAADLLSRTLESMKEVGIVRATLEVNEKNEGAIALYEKFGFKLSGRRTKYYEGEDDALIYWLEFGG